MRAEDQWSLCVAKGRKGVIEYFGDEIGSMPNVYRHAYRVLADYWGPRRGFRHIGIYPTAHSGRRGAAEWIHPDAVMEADPKRKSSKSDPLQLHTFEIERPGGFKIQSIFEAFVQGRGADYSWVLFSSSDIKTDDYWDRVVWAARYVEVGLIEYGKIGSWSTWRTHLAAGKRRRTRNEVVQFKANVLDGTAAIRK